MTDRPAADEMASNPEGALPEGEAPAAASAEMVPAAQVTAALEAAAEFKDKLLRTLAEMENLRRRTEREVNDARVMALPVSPATCWRWPTTCIARWVPSAPSSASKPTPRSRP